MTEVKIRGSELFPREVGEFIRDHVEGTWLTDLTKMVNDRFGTSYTQKQVKSFKKNHKLSSGLTGQFEKGHPSPMRGKPLSYWMPPESIERMKGTQFKKGNRPYNTAEIGKEVHVHFNDNSERAYIKVKVAQPNKWEWKHHLVWEKANGPIPEGYDVDFKDGDGCNCSIENLICVPRGAHAMANLRGYRTYAGEVGLTLAQLELALIEKKGEIEKNEKYDA